MFHLHQREPENEREINKTSNLSVPAVNRDEKRVIIWKCVKLKRLCPKKKPNKQKNPSTNPWSKFGGKKIYI